jgi:hypothetical protein
MRLLLWCSRCWCGWYRSRFRTRPAGILDPHSVLHFSAEWDWFGNKEELRTETVLDRAGDAAAQKRTVDRLEYQGRYVWLLKDYNWWFLYNAAPTNVRHISLLNAINGDR